MLSTQTPKIEQLSDLLILADWHEEQDNMIESNRLKHLHDYCQLLAVKLKQELKQIQGKRRQRILNASDINDMILTCVQYSIGQITDDTGCWYWGGGKVNNSYGYKAWQTVIFGGVDGYGFPRIEVNVIRANGSPSLTTWAIGEAKNRIKRETVQAWAEARIYIIHEDGTICPNDL